MTLTAESGRKAAQAQEATGDGGREAILAAAATCFMSRGFAATSIDEVAESVQATKGMVYHYFRSKADLFFAVHRRGMSINQETIAPIAQRDVDPVERLDAMCRAHLSNMLEYLSFQRVVMQGVEMHLAGSTTPGQRAELELLMRERERYEELFRAVLVEGREAGLFSFRSASFASKAVLAILNNPVIWYRERKDESRQARVAIIDEFTHFALSSVAANHLQEEQK